MTHRRLHHLFLLLALVASLFPAVGSAARARVEGDTTGRPTEIINRAEATYADDGGETYTTVSQTVRVTVRLVAALLVTPDETESSAHVSANETITRTFRICNTGNTQGAYTVSAFDITQPATLVSLHFDADTNGAISPGDGEITIGTTTSQPVAPSQCLAVLAVIKTNDATPNTALSFRLTARSTGAHDADTVSVANEDTGTIINTVAPDATLTAPNDASLPPVKLVNERERETVGANQIVTYQIRFRNSSETTARNVVVRDELHPSLRYVSGSLRLDRASLTDAADADAGTLRGQLLEVRLAEVKAGQTVEITFDARADASAPAATGIVNEAQVSADNALSVATTTAVIITDPHGIVFAARGGTPVSEARVTLLTDETTPAALPPGDASSTNVNAANVNPFTTDGQGRWSFALSAPGTAVRTGSYVLAVSAAGFQPRRIELKVEQGSAQGFFNVTARALDGRPLAQGGGFELTSNDLTFESLARLAFNIPMFEAAALEITKSVDRSFVEIGDTVNYRVEVRNRTGAEITNAVVRDLLPPSFAYAAGSARIENQSATQTGGQAIEPETDGGALLFSLGTIPANSSATLTYRVRVGTNVRAGDARNIAQATGSFPIGERIESQFAEATVRVRSNTFSMRQVLIGRVYQDLDANGNFDETDKPLEGVRVYLANGQSATTDSKGLYNFPLVDDGAIVVSLDPVTVPEGMRLVANGKEGSRGWSRLLRTPLGGGTMLRQNFPLQVSTEDESGVLGDGDAASIASALLGSSALKTPGAPAASRRDSSPDTEAESSTSSPASSSAASSSAASSSAASSSAASSSPAPSAPKSPTLVSTIAAKPVPVFTAPGTYEVETTETIAAVAPGDVLVLSPRADELIRAPALALDVRVAAGWKTAVEVNGELIPETNIGVRRLDHQAQVLTLSYVGVNLHAGPNLIRVTAVNDSGARGKTTELRVFGRGAARHLSVTPERAEIRADNRDSTVLRILVKDEWGNPALDETIAVAVSAGRLAADGDTAATAATNSNFDPAADTTLSLPTAGVVREQLVQLVGGTGTIRLIADQKPGTAIIRASAGALETETEVRFATNVRQAILVGLAEASFGNAAPDIALSGDDARFRSRLRLFYQGALLSNRNLLTLAYDSQRPINRTGGTGGRDRLFELDPNDRAYQVFGDSSTLAYDAQSNSKLYVRVDRNRSFFQFGDYDTATSQPVNALASSTVAPAAAGTGAYGEGAQLALYQRRLTGVQLHLESGAGNYVAVSGARPDTAWARDIFLGDELGLVRLSHTDVLPGSEIVVREVRDRRNPEIILERETLVRGVDYNLDQTTGTLFFLRPITAFDAALNLVQTIATYEHRADGLSSSVFTARGRRRFRDGNLTLGFSLAGERRAGDFGSYFLGGINAEQVLPLDGRARFEFASSRGTATVGGTSFFDANSITNNVADERADGTALRIEVEQPLPRLRDSLLRFGFTRAGGRFRNPFGGSVTGGTQRAALSLEMRPRASSQLRFTLSDERNSTENVNNSRTTASVALTEQVNEDLRLTAGYDVRRYDDDLNDKTTVSNLVTVGADWQATKKLQLSIKREQNLGDADPTYPNQTTFSANYALDSANKLFFTQRLASAPITPIADLSSAGFTRSSARRETALGIESRLKRGTSLNGRYQIENGINGVDSFAVIGLGQRLPVSKRLSLDLTFERGFHLAGTEGKSFTSGGFGFAWQPNENFRSAGRYEIRDRNGFGQLLTLGAAGKIGDHITTLARFQTGRALFGDRSNSTTNGQLALALRPLDTDEYALLLSYTHRSLDVSGTTAASALHEDSDTLSADGLWQPTKNTEIYGRIALRGSGDARADLPSVSTLTFLNQVRVLRRLRGGVFGDAGRFDIAAEGRHLFQPATRSRRTSVGAELGFWATSELRFGVGYNLTNGREDGGAYDSDALRSRRGFYFNISSELSNIFNLFGTPAATGASSDAAPQADGDGGAR